jgi:hypothetical protein
MREFVAAVLFLLFVFALFLATPAGAFVLR